MWRLLLVMRDWRSLLVATGTRITASHRLDTTFKGSEREALGHILPNAKATVATSFRARSLYMGCVKNMAINT